MKKRRKTLYLVVAVLMLLVLAACSVETEAPVASGGASTSASASQSTSGGGKKPVVGFAQMSYTSAWRIAETDDIKAKLEENGYDIIYTDAQNNTQKQVSDVEDILAQKPDYLLLAPREEEGLVPALDAAKKAGVPVILIDRKAKGTPGEDYVCLISSDFVWQGEQACAWLAKKTDGKAKVVEIYGTPGSTSAIDRAAGFREEMKKYPDMEILASQVGDNKRVESQKVMENMIQAYGDQIDAVYTHGDEMTFGAVQAIKAAGLKPNEDILVVSVDGTKEGVQGIIDGEISVEVQCNPRMGAEVIDVLEKLEKGESVEEWIVVKDNIFDETNAKDWVDKL
nr:ABC transporter substrate-binding protein [Maliibacterium massiliense]